jgi:tRNA(Ile2) C34 agmatinyltransferase TiaS
MSGRAGSDCPECGGRLESIDDGMNYECTDCGRTFDSADVFLI